MFPYTVDVDSAEINDTPPRTTGLSLWERGKEDTHLAKDEQLKLPFKRDGE